jgi:hypothetical protein
MAENILGQLAKTVGKKDAIHIAILSVSCYEELVPGMHVKYIYNGKVEACDIDVATGIIDPFLKEEIIPAYTPVQMLLLPNTVTGLRHEWEHSSIEDGEIYDYDKGCSDC